MTWDPTFLRQAWNDRDALSVVIDGLLERGIIREDDSDLKAGEDLRLKDRESRVAYRLEKAARSWLVEELGLGVLREDHWHQFYVQTNPTKIGAVLAAGEIGSFDYMFVGRLMQRRD